MGNAEQDLGRYITRPTVITIFLVCVLLYFLIPKSNISSESEKVSRPKSSKEQWNNKGKDGKSMDEEADTSEFVHGTKRFRLYERKQLNFKKAETFCKKMDGRLARTDNLEEMVRLQSLLRKARMVTDEIWMGQERKVWKQHEWRDKPGPPGMNPDALKEMGAMMMGGGKEQMCPSLSLSTRALAASACYKELPFICEFERYPSGKPEKEVFRANKAPVAKNKGKGKGKNEKGKTPVMKPSSQRQKSGANTNKGRAEKAKKPMKKKKVEL